MSDEKDKWFEQKAFKEGWPKGVKPIGAYEDVLGINKRGNLFFEGKEVEIKKRFSLTGWQNLFAGAAASATVLIAIVEILNFLGSCRLPVCP